MLFMAKNQFFTIFIETLNINRYLSFFFSIISLLKTLNYMKMFTNIYKQLIMTRIFFNYTQGDSRSPFIRNFLIFQNRIIMKIGSWL
jgi:hypothetical protein